MACGSDGHSPRRFIRPPSDGSCMTRPEVVEVIRAFRQARHLDVGRNRPGGGQQHADQRNAMLSDNPQSASQGKIWEDNRPSAGEFARRRLASRL